VAGDGHDQDGPLPAGAHHVILDIISHYMPGCMPACAESATLAKTLVEETLRQQRIGANQLTLYSERFVRKPPAPTRLQTVALINEPKEMTTTTH